MLISETGNCFYTPDETLSHDRATNEAMPHLRSVPDRVVRRPSDPSAPSVSRPNLCVSELVIAVEAGIQDGAPLLTFVGDLDFSVAPAVRSVLETVVPDVVDLSGVPYLDGRIMHEFLRTTLTLAPHRLTLIGARPSIRRMIDILRVAEHFTFADGPALAAASRLVWTSRLA